MASLPKGDRIGSMIQLFGVGSQDTHLTYRPEVTHFKQTYLQHEPYGVDTGTIDLPLLENQWGATQTLYVPKSGTYLSNLVLVVRFQDSGIDTQVVHSLNRFPVLSLIDSILFKVGQEVFDTVTPETFLVRTSSSHGSRWKPVLRHAEGVYKEGWIECMFPLPFWFCHWRPGFDNGSKLPLASVTPTEPVSVEVRWKNKESSVSICSQTTRVKTSLWVDYIICSPMETGVLRTSPREELIVTHHQETFPVSGKKGWRLELPFRGLCREIAWGYRPSIDVSRYIQAQARSSFHQRLMLASETRSVEDVLSLLDTCQEEHEDFYQVLRLLHKQVPRYTTHQYTLDWTLHDYIQEQGSQLYLGSDISWGHPILGGDYKQLFPSGAVSTPDNFVRVNGPFRYGLSCNERSLHSTVARSYGPLHVSFVLYPSFPFGYLETCTASVPLISFGAKQSWLAIEMNPSSVLSVMWNGTRLSTGILVPSNSGRVHVEVEFTTLGTRVTSQGQSFLVSSAIMPNNCLYLVSLGAMPDLRSVRNRALERSMDSRSSPDWPLEYPEAYEVASTLPLIGFTGGTKHVSTPEIEVGISASSLGSVESDSEGHVYLFDAGSTLQVQGKEGLLATKTIPVSGVTHTFYDSVSMTVYGLTDHGEIFAIDTVTFEEKELPPGTVPALATSTVAVGMYQGELTVVGSDLMNVFWGANGTVSMAPGTSLKDAIVTHDTLYLLTDQQLIRIRDQEVQRTTVLHDEGELFQVHRFILHDSMLYLLATAPTPGIGYTKHTSAVVRYSAKDLQRDIRFGTQPVMDGRTWSGAPELTLVSEEDVMATYTAGDVSYSIDSYTLQGKDAGGTLTTETPVRFHSQSFSAHGDNYVISHADGLVYNDGGGVTYDFSVHGGTRVRVSPGGTVMAGTSAVYRLSRLAIIENLDKVLFAHPLVNRYFSIVYVHTDGAVHVNIYSLSLEVEGEATTVSLVTSRELVGLSPESPVLFSVCQNEVTYTVEGTDGSTVSYFDPPLYDREDTYQASHLTLYDASMVPFRTSDHVVAFNGSEFLVDHSVVFDKTLLTDSAPHDSLLFVPWGSSLFLYVCLVDGETMHLKLLALDPTVGIQIEAEVWFTTGAVQNVFHEPFQEDSLAMYVNLDKYTITYDGFEVMYEKTPSEGEGVVARRGRFYLSHGSSGSMIHDLLMEYPPVSFDPGASPLPRVPMHADESHVTCTIGSKRLRFSLQTPLPTFVGPSSQMAVLDQRLHVYVDSDHGPIEVRFPPMPWEPTTLEDAMEEEFQASRASLPYQGVTGLWHASDLAFSPSDTLSDLEESRTYRCESSEWTLRFTDDHGACVLSDCLFGDGTVVAWDIFGKNLSPLLLTSSLSGNSLRMVFSTPVCLDRVTSTKDIGSVLSVQTFVYLVLDDAEMYYFAGSHEVTGSYEFGPMERRTRATQHHVPSVAITEEVATRWVNVLDGLTFIPPWKARVELGEARLPEQVREYTYYTQVVPFYKEILGDVGASHYAFCLYPNYFQPSGHYNMSVTENFLQLDFHDVPDGEVVVTGTFYNGISNAPSPSLLFP